MMQKDLVAVSGSLGRCDVMWSEIVPRRVWRGARDPVAVEHSRYRTNLAMRKFLVKRGMGCIRHELIQAKVEGYYEPDGVHLSQVGMDLVLLDFQEALGAAGCK